MATLIEESQRTKLTLTQTIISYTRRVCLLLYAPLLSAKHSRWLLHPAVFACALEVTPDEEIRSTV